MLLRGTAGIYFRIFPMYPAPKLRFEIIKKTWAWDFSVRKLAILWVLLHRIGRKMNRLTDTDEENVWNFFSEFFNPSPIYEWDFKWRKRDLNFRKYAILLVLRNEAQRKMIRSIGTVQKNVWNFFQIFLFIFKKIENSFLEFVKAL